MGDVDDALDRLEWGTSFREQTTRANAATVRRELQRLREEQDEEVKASLLAAAQEMFPDFDFSGCYDADDLRNHVAGQAEQLREERDGLRETLARHREGLRSIEGVAALWSDPEDTGTPSKGAALLVVLDKARALLADSPTSSPTVMSPVQPDGAKPEGGEA